MGSYDDIFNLSRPDSRHPRMPMAGRAAQFSPFAALSGYEDAVRETARHTDRRIELTEDRQMLLDEKLRLLLDIGGEAMFTWFLPDKKKDGGAYVTGKGKVKKIDPLKGHVILTDGTVIPMEDLLEIEGESLPGWDL